MSCSRFKQLSIMLAISGLAINSSGVPGQQLVAKPSPDRLDFGVVRLNSKIEGSVRVYGPRNSQSGLPSINVKGPRHVRVKHIAAGDWPSGSFAARKNMVYCDVWVSLNTEAAGEISGVLSIALGNDSTEIPISANVQLQVQDSRRILILESPFSLLQTGNSADLAPWRELVDRSGMHFDYVDSINKVSQLHKMDLSGYETIVLTGNGLAFLRAPDVERLSKFVSEGGRLITATNARSSELLTKLNLILGPSGMKMTNVHARGKLVLENFERSSHIGYPYAIIRDRLTMPSKILEHSLTVGVDDSSFHQAQIIKVTERSKSEILILSTAKTRAFPFPRIRKSMSRISRSYGEAPIVAIGRSGEGEIITVGVAVWWNTVQENSRLWMNLLSR